MRDEQIAQVLMELAQEHQFLPGLGRGLGFAWGQDSRPVTTSGSPLVVLRHQSLNWVRNVIVDMM